MTRLLKTVLLSLPLLAFGNSQSQKDPICEEIRQALGNSSALFYPDIGDAEFDKGVYHFYSSSSEASKCVVEPATSTDVGKVLRIVGRTKTKFAVKSGGHAYNLGHSSTPGVQIYMGRFSGIELNATAQTVDVGTGLIWDDVYRALDPHDVSVIGGRVTGVGVGGVGLGGGYSWKTNQYGLAIDSIVAYELVKPDGSVVRVTSSDRDLFFALKGGFNNFGVVTKFTLKTYPQTQVWGGILTFLPNATQELTNATASFFAEVSDPKAALISNYIYASGMLFYDGPTPPKDIFERFTRIPSLTQNVSTLSYVDHFFAVSANVNATAGIRSKSSTISLTALTTDILDVVVSELQYWGEKLGDNTTFFAYNAEPFIPSAYSHNISETAYPSVRSPALLPFEIEFGWTDPAKDSAFFDAFKQTTAKINAAAIQQGQKIADLPVYPNYALQDTPLQLIYGDNLPRLKDIKAKIDPSNVMGLAGGFKL
ncbi:hypothetical protein CPB83DRAFT_935955 [Crepidotus variabilis]|uniref:FAD-binding PCMH-type domain-containing protein n=1 Tax=Crepidotus variabilis TaxID=179855 RepID=A0A9P6EDS8_9AGAR|nr:hypothetical protein CPB83DRAFT_935955 [Crepidotus variabilis]